MMNRIVPFLLIATILLTSTILVSSSYAKSKEEKAIDKALDKIGYKNVCILGANTKTDSNAKMIYDNPKCHEIVPPVDPTCKANEHLENHVCVPNVEPPTNGIPTLNTSKTTRVAVIGDVDDNSGLVTELKLMQKYKAQFLVLPGDFDYNDGKHVLSTIASYGFTKANTALANGNHDSCSLVVSFSGFCFGDQSFTSQVQVITIDANQKFDCSSSQYKQIKSDIETSDAWYKLVNIHQPFATVKSDHGPNGQFSCYHSLFKANGVDAVLQAHNHNYQRFLIDNILYGVFGTGTHDTGSKMYPIDSTSFDGNKCLKCDTGTNGITLLDLKIDNASSRQINGYFVSHSDKVVDSFVIKS